MLKDLYGPKGPQLTQDEVNHIFSSQGRYMTCRGGAFTRLKGASLDGLNLANRNLKDADLSGTSLVGANLCGSNLTHASLYCADLRGCNLQNADLMHADMRGASFKGAGLSHAVLDYADLRAGMMMCVGAHDVSITDRGDLQADPARCPGSVDFSNCKLNNASFGNARLDNVNFDGALMTGARFRGAKLTNASFKGAVLIGVNLQELAVPPESLTDCILSVSDGAMKKAAGLAAVVERHQHWVLSNGAQGAAAVLDGEDLRPLCRAFTGRKLIGLSARNVLGIGVDFSGCELQGAKFDHADLRDSNFTGANLNGASFKGARLAHAKFNAASLRSLSLLSGMLVRPDLSGAEAIAGQFEGASLDESVSALGLAAA